MIRVPVAEFAADSIAFLARVERGEEVWIERDGVVIAKLKGAAVEPPASKSPPRSESELGRRFRQAREGVTLGGIDWRELRDEGRR